jgi:hypothetical protein
MGHESDASRLCYLSPAQVEGPLPEGHLDVRDRDNRRIGRFGGVIVDPRARRLLYLVLDAPGVLRHRRYLIPIDPTRIDAEHRALRVGIHSDELAGCTNFDPSIFPNLPDLGDPATS